MTALVGGLLRIPTISLTLAVAIIASARPVAGQFRRPPVGCYDFSVSSAKFSWHTFESWSRTFAVHSSRLIEFTLTPGDRKGTFLLRAPGMRDTTAQREFGRSSWWRIAPDSIALSWGDGLTGLNMQLWIRGDTLLGTATGYSDVLMGGQRTSPHATAKAFPVPCPTPPRPDSTT